MANAQYSVLIMIRSVYLWMLDILFLIALFCSVTLRRQTSRTFNGMILEV